MSRTQLNVIVPADVKQQLKVMAALHGQTIEQIATRALSAEIQKLQKKMSCEESAIAS